MYGFPQSPYFDHGDTDGAPMDSTATDDRSTG
jgi:hypothetical protein